MRNGWIEPLSRHAPHRISHPLMRQSWRDLTFLHWSYDPAAVRPLLPPGLDLDIHDGAAWIGLVPFRIVGLTLPRAPSVPWLSNFAETNLRTYVVDAAGLRGVWFFSLDAARLAAVLGARVRFALPYYWARMSIERHADSISYRSRRLRAATDIEVGIGEPLTTPSELEIFLTARYRLYAQRGGRLLKADVEHAPWPLRRAEPLRVMESLTAAAGLPAPTGTPLGHFADRADVVVAAPQEVGGFAGHATVKNWPI